MYLFRDLSYNSLTYFPPDFSGPISLETVSFLFITLSLMIPFHGIPFYFYNILTVIVWIVHSSIHYPLLYILHVMNQIRIRAPSVLHATSPTYGMDVIHVNQWMKMLHA